MILMNFGGSESSGKIPEGSNENKRPEKATRLRKLMLKDFFNLFLFLFISSVGIFVLVTYLVLLPHLRSLEGTIRKVTTLLESGISDLDEFVVNAECDISSHISERISTFKNKIDTTISEFIRSQWATDSSPTQSALNFLQGPYKIERTQRVDQNELTAPAERESFGTNENLVFLKMTEIGEDLYLVGKLSTALTKNEEITIMLNETERVRRNLVPNLVDTELSFKSEVERLLSDFAKVGVVFENAKLEQKAIIQTELSAFGQQVTWDASPNNSEPEATILLSILGQTYAFEIPSLRSEVSEKLRKFQEELKNTSNVANAVSKFVADLQDLENVEVRYTINSVEPRNTNEGTETEPNSEVSVNQLEISYNIDKEKRACGFTLTVTAGEEAHLVTFWERSKWFDRIEAFRSRLSKLFDELSRGITQTVGNVQNVQIVPAPLTEEYLTSRGLGKASLKLINIARMKEGSQAELTLKFLNSLIVVQYDPIAEITSQLVAKLTSQPTEETALEIHSSQDEQVATEVPSIDKTIADLYSPNHVQQFSIERTEEAKSDHTPFSSFSISSSGEGSILAEIRIGGLLYLYRYNSTFAVMSALDSLLRVVEKGDIASPILEVNKLLASKNVADLQIREVHSKEVPPYLRSSFAGEYDYLLRFYGTPEIKYEVYLKARDRYIYFSFSESRRIEKMCATSAEKANKYYENLMKDLREYLRSRLGVKQLTETKRTLGLNETKVVPEISHAIEVKRGDNVNVRVSLNLFGRSVVFSATKSSLDFMKNELKSIFENLGTVESIYIFSERGLREKDPKPLLVMKSSQKKDSEVAIEMLRRSMSEQRPIVEMLSFAGTGLPRFVSVALPIRVKDVRNLFLYAQYETNVMLFMLAGAALLFVNVLAMIILLLLTKRHAESISRPFEVLTQSMEEFAESKLFDPEKLPKSNVLEVQKLVQYYASLAEELAASIEELRATNEELEDSYKVIEELSREIEDSYMKFAEQLAVIAESYDESTGNHIERVGELSYFIACELGLGQETAEKIRKFAPLHDIGKILIPKEILDKPGKLTDEEFELMKKHTIYGEKLIGGKEYFRIARNIALYHHEKYDGSGYPYGLKGDEIPVEAQIVAVVDVYDALRSERPYKKAFSHEEALSIIVNGDNRTRPTHFAPNVLEVFKKHGDEIRKLWDEVSKRTMLKKVSE